MRGDIRAQRGHVILPGHGRLSTRNTSGKADSEAAVQSHRRTANERETAVLQLKVSGGGTYLQQTRSVLLLFSVIVPQGRESGRHSKVAVMQSTDNRNRNQATRSGQGLRFGCGKRRIAVQSLMWAGDVVILLDELLHQAFQVFFIKDNHVIQQLSP